MTRATLTLSMVLVWMVLATPPTFAATIVVNSTDDTINSMDGKCTLREAIIAANTNLPSGLVANECLAGDASPAVDSIVFAISGAGTHTINVTSSLPVVLGDVVIDGGNNGVAANRVELFGGGTIGTGLQLENANNAIRNLVINGFTSKQLYLLFVTNSTIQGNYLGMNAAGTAFVTSSGRGLTVEASSGIQVGGTTAAARNVVTALNDPAIVIDGAGATVQGNYVGLNAAGTAKLANASVGVGVINASPTIGGLAAGAGNVIAAQTGIRLTGNPALGHSSGTIQGNYIGTDATGTVALNLAGAAGIDISHGTNALISGNVISGNLHGVTISSNGSNGTSSSDNTIQGNFIGTAADGVSPLGNAGNGIFLSNTDNNKLGGSNPGDGNVIAFNGQAGVHIASGVGHPILRNSIHANGARGIALGSSGSPNVNDLGDTDSGANNLQNYPELTAGSFQGANIVVSGSLPSSAMTNYRIEFFASGACDPSGNGEGRTFIGTTDVTTSAGGSATFTNLSFPATGGPVISAAATVKTGATTFTDTSEFSACFLIATLDIDGDGNYEPLIDGFVALRYMFGLTGSALTDGIAFPAAAQRKTPAAIQQYLDYIKPALDADGNTTADALTDGMLIIRYMFGLRDNALVANVIGQNPTRNADQIETYIASLMPM